MQESKTISKTDYDISSLRQLCRIYQGEFRDDSSDTGRKFIALVPARALTISRSVIVTEKSSVFFSKLKVDEAKYSSKGWEIIVRG